MGKYLKRNNLQGFSLFELLVTMGIMMLLALMVFPFATQKVQESKLESYVSKLTTDLLFQQQRSALKNIPGGVALNLNSYTLFDGETLLTSTERDEKKYPNNIMITSISLTGSNEITFPAGEFKPTSYGTLVITDGQNSIRVYINKEGLIDYEKL